jgi:H+/Na+-translocating ferredoxin:NAD+ oxidoreductase subunit G
MSTETKTQVSPPPPPVMEDSGTSGATMIRTMAAIGLACGILIVLTYQLTYATIKENKARYLEKSIFEVLPNTTEKITFAYVDDVLRPLEEDEEAELLYYAGYDSNHQLTGIAVEAEGQGFQDLLRILYGYSPACHCIVGMKVLESKETPGLGDKIETDPKFRANFDALDVTLKNDKLTIANPIVLVKPRQKTNLWQIEAISGATISSRAIVNMLKTNTASAIPFIESNLNTFKGSNK